MYRIVTSGATLNSGDYVMDISQIVLLIFAVPLIALVFAFAAAAVSDSFNGGD